MKSGSQDRVRRRWLGFGVAALAGGAGAGFAWWQQRESAEQRALGTAAKQFWRMSFEQTDGSLLYTAALHGKPLLVNFWATWCPPCVKEMPLLDQFARQSGWQVLGLALDRAEPVREFLRRVPVSFSIALAGAAGPGLTRDLGNLGGQLPYSVVFDSTGKVAVRHLGAVDEQMLADWRSRIA